MQSTSTSAAAKIRAFDPWLAVVIVLGAAMRVPELVTGIFRDEGVTYFDITAPSVTAMLREVAVAEYNPPGYFLLMWIWTHLFGVSELALKLPSFIFGVALIVVAYVAGRVFVSRAVGIVAAAFVAITSAGVMLSGDARPYTLAALLALAAAIAIGKLITSERPALWAGAFWFFGTTLIYVHYSGIIFAGALIVGAVFAMWCAGRLERALPLGVAVAGMCVAYLPYAPTLMQHLATRPAWAPVPTEGHYFERLIEQLGYASPFNVLRVQTAYLGLAGLLAFLVLVGSQRGMPEARARAPLAGAAICVLIGAIVETALRTPTESYMYVFAPLAQVLFAAACVLVAQTIISPGTAPVYRWLNGLVAIYFVAGVLIAQPGHYVTLYKNLERSGMRAAARDLYRLPLRSTLFIAAPDYLASGLGYYLRGRSNLPLVGFAHWDQPQYFRPRLASADWNDPAALERFERRVAARVPAYFDRIAFVTSPDLQYRGTVPYTRVNDVRNWLEGRYEVLSVQNYPAYDEPVTLIVLKPR